MKYLLLFFALLLIAINGMCTWQKPDKIILEGKIYDLEYCYPLEPYFDLHPEKRPELHVFSTGLARGYVATYDVRSDSLYLINLEVEVHDSIDPVQFGTHLISVINKVFPNREDRRLGFINEILIIPPIMDYVERGEHYKLKTIDKHYVFLEVHDGVIKKKVRINRKRYDAYSAKMFIAFKETPEYEVLRKIKVKSFGEEEADMVIQDEIMYLSKHLVDD